MDMPIYFIAGACKILLYIFVIDLDPPCVVYYRGKKTGGEFSMAEYYSPEEKREIQLDGLDILLKLDGICRENGLTYYLTAGTLLGAVRHGGFIPWDDDIDVAMPRRDFDKLSRIAGKLLPEGYFYQDTATEKEYPFLFSKIRKAGPEVHEEILSGVNIRKGRYIDIFPLDKCPDSPRTAGAFFKVIEFIKMAMLVKTDSSIPCGYTRRIPKLAFSVATHMPRWMLRLARRSAVGLFGGLSSGKRLCTVAGTHGYPKETYESEWFVGEKEMLFEGRSFPVPMKTEALLQNMYGDYMTPPEESERGGHFTKK